MATVLQPEHIVIETSEDIILARASMRRMCTDLGFSRSTLTLLVTVVSELTRNILQHAGHGEIVLTPLRAGRRVGIEVEAHDSGTGIVDLNLAMRIGYSTTGGLGLGLPAIRRGMDEFEIESAAGKGTRVVVRKWAVV